HKRDNVREDFEELDWSYIHRTHPALQETHYAIGLALLARFPEGIYFRRTFEGSVSGKRLQGA
ncbi:MAG: hypothetical protein AAGB19_10365, partial [Cyanobacteria bacterium P01_F01_bin.3]